jgi:hypothetical protein
LRCCVLLCEGSAIHMTMLPIFQTCHQPSVSSKHFLCFIRYFTSLKLLLWDRLCAELSSTLPKK